MPGKARQRYLKRGGSFPRDADSELAAKAIPFDPDIVISPIEYRF
jgi:hypothetical protein